MKKRKKTKRNKERRKNTIFLGNYSILNSIYTTLLDSNNLFYISLHHLLIIQYIRYIHPQFQKCVGFTEVKCFENYHKHSSLFINEVYEFTGSYNALVVFLLKFISITKYKP